MNELFVSWTPAAILTAVLSGAAFAFIVHHLRPAADHRIVGFLAAVLFSFWFAPQLIRLWLEVSPTSAVRQTGVWLLAEVWFVGAAWLVLRQLNRAAA